MSTELTSLSSRLAAARLQLHEFDRMRKEAFQPAPPMPAYGQPPMGGPPMGGLPMDPSMMMQQPPMDPSMMMQQPPMAPSAGGQPSVDPEQMGDVLSLLEELANAVNQISQRLDSHEQVIQQQAQQQAQQADELTSAIHELASRGGQGKPEGGW